MLQTSAAFAGAQQACRRPVVPACDPTIASGGVNPPSVDGQIVLIKAGDVIDVGLDWSDWLEGNGGKLASSAWAKHSASPKTPTLTDGTLIDDASKQTLVIVDTSEAAVGDVYYLENTVSVEGIAAGGFTMPTRTLKRVLHVKVVL